MSRRQYYGTNEECVDAYVNMRSYDGRTPTENMYFDGNVIYSYGSHFPMAVRLQNGFYILNGDKYSTTTGKHQSILWRQIPNTKRVEIPYSALLGALGRGTWRGYGNLVTDILDINVIEWKEDRYVNTGRFTKDGNIIYDHILGGTLFELDGRMFLSSIDESGTGHGLFFLTEIVDKTVATIDEAFESLKPEEVKQAEASGETVLRQGEWFFVPVEQVEKEITENSEKKYMLKNRDEQREDRHFATDGAEFEGRQFVRGVIRHNGGEHRQLKLYEEGTRASKRPWFEAFENIQVESWAASGNVD